MMLYRNQSARSAAAGREDLTCDHQHHHHVDDCCCSCRKRRRRRRKKRRVKDGAPPRDAFFLFFFSVLCVFAVAPRVAAASAAFSHCHRRLLKGRPSHRRGGGGGCGFRRFFGSGAIRAKGERTLATTSDDGGGNVHNHKKNDDVVADDTAVLKTVTKDQLKSLCRQLKLPVSGTKTALLRRLRAHAEAVAASERRAAADRAAKVADGCSDDPKERYEIVGGGGGSTNKRQQYWKYGKNDDDAASTHDDDDVDDDDVGFFYYALPDEKEMERDIREAMRTSDKSGKRGGGQQASSSSSENEDAATKKKKSSVITAASVTAPPVPADAVPNERGERVVTVYSTADENDLTGIAAAQPGTTASAVDALGKSAASTAVGSSSSSSSRPWERPSSDGQQQQQQQTVSTPKELERVKEDISRLVRTLLATTGAPAFRCLLDEDDDDEEALLPNTKGFVGFSPAAVPEHLLSKALPSLLSAGRRGHALQDVLRTYELQAVGQDGAAADDRDRGGGHYREVLKVRAFLEGYRAAALQKRARETASQLLDKLVQEGVSGLDMTLSGMSRPASSSSGGGVDDSGLEATAGAELNDALLDYLDDAIKQQQKKVNEMAVALATNSNDDENSQGRFYDIRNSEISNSDSSDDDDDSNDDDPVQNLWNVTNENGERVEAIDPNDPQVRQVLLEESMKEQKQQTSSSTARMPEPEPASGPEQLLLLLTLLRERLRAEAVVPANDEKGQNLRLLAYCLRVDDDQEREQLICHHLGTSVDRFDSFLELVESSIEYGESTSHQLQPSKRRPLDVPLLKRIRQLTAMMRTRTVTTAAGSSSRSRGVGGGVGGVAGVGAGGGIL